MKYRRIECKSVDWEELACDKVQWWAFLAARKIKLLK
jgi:hypothetical protein